MSEPLADSLGRTLDELEVPFNEKGDDLRVRTGFRDLDDLLGGGLGRGHLSVIGGAPAMGCSTLAFDIARTEAVHNERSTLFVSPDTGETDLNYRLLSAEAKVPLNHLRNGMISDEDWTKLARRMQLLAGSPLVYNTDPHMTVAKIEEAVDDVLPTSDLRLVVIDGLQSLLPDPVRESRYFEVCEIVHALKRLARSRHIAVLLTSKLNRNLEQRADKRPMLPDLRNAGDIEDVADVVVLIHRDDVYERESLRPGEADLIVAKHRHGPTQDITVAFQGHYARFIDMAR